MKSTVYNKIKEEHHAICKGENLEYITVTKLKDLQTYTEVYQGLLANGLTELNKYEYTELVEVIDMETLARGILFTGYFIEEEIDSIAEGMTPETFWGYRVWKQFNLMSTRQILGLENKGSKIFTRAFCEKLLLEILKANFIIKTDIISEEYGISKEDAIKILTVKEGVGYDSISKL